MQRLIKFVWLLIVIPSMTMATEYIKTDGKPVAVDLQVGKERVIDFGNNIVFKKEEVGPHLSNVFSHQGKLFLTAKEAFPIKRMKVRYVDSGETIILDVSATQRKVQRGDAILVGSGKFSEKSESPRQQEQATQSFVTQAKPLGPIDLLRFAAQDSYAPSRLKSTDHRFSITKVNTKLDLSELFIGQSYALYDARMIKGWFVKGNYLTVIAVRNRSTIPRQLNLFDLNVDAISASAQHIALSQRDVAGDSTRIYVITKQPFEKALGAAPLIVGG
ncbi:TIGR03749 family integrating conjugative element protein [Photobacterium sp. GB-72]|uniref:TIGR03749 family integrating conjugative element protein n=1 Tax=Photobacterium sp. GB-72 TaxID=2022105 RepID=UPI000D160910|nr:TIGR03749 family integrating conjugative element protein [Photobacterium sp. GB-72]PSV28063.1 TIGR03749 family integrating conjugative element protein [Photobacterium sp. GB-72]